MQRSESLLSFLKLNRSQFDALLFDIDGTIIDNGSTLPGAAELLNWMRSSNFPFLFLTNDGNHTVEYKTEYLNQAGLTIQSEEIVSCAHAIEDYAEETGLSNCHVFIMGDLGVSFNPFIPNQNTPSSIPQSKKQTTIFETRDLAALPDCDGVILGEGVYDWHSVISAVFNFFIKKPEAFLIVPNPDSYWPNGDLGLGIGSGAIARFLQNLLREYGIEKDVTYLGKPHPLLFQRAFHVLRRQLGGNAGTNPERLLMVGDSLKADIQGANSADCRSALVLTGLTKPERLTEDCGRTGIRPWLVVDRL